jgi:hypothetical protein
VFSPLDLAEAIFEYGQDGPFVFLKSYGDDSSDWQNQEIVCAGSFLGWPKQFFYAGLEWEARLKQYNLEYFRACECEDLRGQFDPQRLGVDLSQARAIALAARYDLIQVIGPKIGGMGSISVALLRKDFQEVLTEEKDAADFFGTDPVRLVYKRLIRVTIDLLQQDWPNLPKSVKLVYVFDEHQKWKEAEEEYNRLKEDDAVCAARMAFAGHADDKETIGLQMADLAAYEARLKALQYQSSGNRIPFQLMANNHSVYFIGLWNKEHLLKELEASRVTK